MLLQIFSRLALLIVAIISLNGCLSEANFELASDSRLPKWFFIPEGMSRNDFTVTRDDYVYYGRPESVFKLYKRDGFFREKKIVGTVQIIKGSPSNYPIYAAVTINGVTDIIEQRAMEPIFYMVDDPAIWAEFRSSSLVPKY